MPPSSQQIEHLPPFTSSLDNWAQRRAYWTERIGLHAHWQTLGLRKLAKRGDTSGMWFCVQILHADFHECFHLACHYGYLRLLMFLMAMKKITKKCFFLKLAIQRGHASVTKFLVQEWNARKYALACARLYNQPAIARVLRSMPKE